MAEISNKELLGCMLISEQVIKEDWDNNKDSRWDALDYIRKA